MLGACFGGCGGQLVPPYHTELGREELKALYDKSVAVNNGRLIVHGIFARADTKNNNKRVYPRWILKREVTKYEFAHIAKGTALGELDHPNYASRYFKCLNLPNISHQVLEVQWKGDQLWGSIEVLSTPSGLLLRELYSQGIKLGVSSRGWASLRTDPKAKCVFVDEDFELITFDFVTEPSTKGAYLVPIKCAYRQRVPDQSKCTQIAHLGHGVVSMRSIPRLPDLPTLVMRVNELQTKVGLSYVASAMSTKAHLTHTVTGPPACSPQCEHLADSRQTGLQQQPPASSQAQQSLPVAKAHMLDELLLFSHYIVFQAATYIDREQHARDFQSHLAMFATRAHLADQQQLMNRADLNAIILREMAREEAAAAAAAAPSPSLPALTGSAHCSIPAPTSQSTPAKQAKTAPCSAAEPVAGGGCRSDSKLSQACASHSHSALSAGIHPGPSPPHSTSMSASQSSGADAAAAAGRPTHAAQHTNSQHSPDARTGPSSSDLTAWTLHPNAIDVHSNTDIAAIADQLQQQAALSTSTSRRATSPCIQEPPLPLPLPLPSHLPPQGSGQDCHLAPPAPTLPPFTLTPPPPAALVLPGCSLPDALPGDGRTPGLAGRLPAHRPVSGGQRGGAAWGKAEGAMGHAPCLPGLPASQRLLAAGSSQGQGADASPAAGPPGPGQRGSQGSGQALQAVPGWQPTTQQSQQQSQQSQQQQQQQASPWQSPPRKPGAALASGYGESTTGCGSVSEEVAAELQRIRSTLAHFAEKYNQAQRAVMRMYNARLPVPESGISITLDLSTRL